MADSEKKYQTERKETFLLFRTESFSAEREGVLHKGIYNKEFASVLSSLATAGLIFAALAMQHERTILPHVAFAVIFIGGYPLFRMFVFKDRSLEALFDQSRGLAEISISGLIGKKTESFPLLTINSVLIERLSIGVENPDGVEFVEKIAAQHGTVIPGFGEEKTFFLLKLILADGCDRLIYADTEMKDVMDAHAEIKEFLKL